MQCQEYGEHEAKAKQKAGLIMAPLNAALQGMLPITAKVGDAVERPQGGIWIMDKQPTLPSVTRGSQHSWRRLLLSWLEVEFGEGQEPTQCRFWRGKQRDALFFFSH